MTLPFAAKSVYAQNDRNSLPTSVAAAYQRAIFELNLNPVVWEQVRTEAETIAQSVRPYDAAVATELMNTIDHVIKVFSNPPPPPPDQDLPVGAEEANESDTMPRSEAARQIFTQLTRAIGSLIVHDLNKGAQAELTSPSMDFTQAKDGLDALAPYLHVYDPKSLDRLMENWRELSTPTPSSNSKDRQTEASKALAGPRSEISTYISDNFGVGFTATGTGPFFPVPRASKTANCSVRMPTILPPGSQTAKPRPRPRQVLNSVERGAAEREMPLSSLGAAAFDNPFIFGEPARALGISCNSCHDKGGINPGFFIPGLSIRPGGIDVSNSFFAPHGNNAAFDPLDIPDLRGIRFTAPYGRNGRFASLREFVRNVIVNEFNGEEPDPVLLDGMVAYMNEFDFLQNPSLERNGTLNRRASEMARRGEKVFNRPFSQFGGSSCASCHIPSANFLDHKRHDIGTVRGYADFSLDRALDTPTLLGTSVTAPYFHDGSQPTLRSVVEWFDREYRLGLPEQEISDLTSYLSTVGNGIHAFEPGDRFLAEDLEDQEAFLSTFEFLVEKRKWGLIEALLRGVSAEIRQHEVRTNDMSMKAVLANLAGTLEEAAGQCVAGDYGAVRMSVESWRMLYRTQKYELR